MKKFLVLFLPLILLTGCGDTSAVDRMIEESAAQVTEISAPVITEEIILSEAPPAETDITVSSEGELTETSAFDENEAADDVDVDLTVLDGNMVYAQMYAMLSAPEDYLGQTVKAKGTFTSIVFDGNMYFAVYITDAAACCAQGLEFRLAGEHEYPADYPEPDSEITIKGVFNTYMEDEYTYCELKDAVIL